MSIVGNTLGGMNWSGLGSQFIFWIGWSLAAIFILGGMVAIYYLLQFNIKAETWKLYGSGKDGVFSIGKKQKNRIRWAEKKTSWRSLFPLFNKKNIEPFDTEFVYPGKQVYAFILNDEWVPGRINIDLKSKWIKGEEKERLEGEVLDFLQEKYPTRKSFVPGVVQVDMEEKELRAQINPAPHYMRNWQSLQHKKNAVEFAEHNFWEDNKYFFMVIITAILCLIMVGVTVYFTYKFATGGNAAMGNLADALRSWNTLQSI